ncbi:pyridoxamine 5'-phosphate oxidase family protein [Methylobacterium organophilum]|uniref:pyridoxamine 5'-phosphate oxidase family protein n=1 Tax=Methylobacterium organophilum TaxID=410 RepID=UPI001F13D051|nr:pyridoxamine 5'-phosphate oxidase family protein [Methylobacterium organophilum]UMY19076.1 pyridoxamine 5'-phosphate oxidase family protein [Methylobacterium organophilum]
MDALPPFYDNLDAAHEALWRLLEDGVHDRRSAFHTPTLGTVDAQGRAQIRTVVLRAADAYGGTLRFHCDRRSEKATEIALNGGASLHAFDAGARIQIRVEGSARLHTDDLLADEAWRESREQSRLCYGIAPSPGTALREGGDYTLPDTPQAIAAGRKNFAAVVLHAERLEFLYLDHRGHRRGLWLRSDAGWVECWLVP